MRAFGNRAVDHEFFDAESLVQALELEMDVARRSANDARASLFDPIVRGVCLANIFQRLLAAADIDALSTLDLQVETACIA